MLIKKLLTSSEMLTKHEILRTRPAWAGFKTAEEGRTKIM
jgi:hypothetical protein